MQLRAPPPFILCHTEMQQCGGSDPRNDLYIHITNAIGYGFVYLIFKKK